MDKMFALQGEDVQGSPGACIFIVRDQLTWRHLQLNPEISRLSGEKTKYSDQLSSVSFVPRALDTRVFCCRLSSMIVKRSMMVERDPAGCWRRSRRGVPRVNSLGSVLRMVGLKCRTKYSVRSDKPPNGDPIASYFLAVVNRVKAPK
jgi:hypothetical protein